MQDHTPSKSSPVALQRIVSLDNAAAAAQRQGKQLQQGQRQQRQETLLTDESGAYGGIVQLRDAQPTVASKPRSRRRTDPSAGAGERESRMKRLALLLQERPASGERQWTLAQLQEAGYSSMDVQAFKQWLVRQQRHAA